MRIIKVANWVLMAAACVLGFAQSRASEVDEENPGGLMPVPDRVCAKLQALCQKYYPKAVFTNLGLNGIYFEYDVTTYQFPAGDPTRKHENPIQRGPKKGGIECHVVLAKGKYRGQIALTPRGFSRPGHLPKLHIPYLSQPAVSRNGNSQYELLINRGVYKELLLAPYSVKRDAHLGGGVAYPSDASEDFLKEFCAIMDAFGEDAD